MVISDLLEAVQTITSMYRSVTKFPGAQYAITLGEL